MAEIDHRDFFISFNSADLAYAEAIDAALRAAGFTTHFHPRDLGAGGNIPIWMDEALMASAQTLALYSPDYMKDQAIYSRAERYASWWQDPGDDRRKLIPVLLRDTKLTPLMAPISRIEVIGLTPKEAAARVVERLKAPKETEHRGRWHKLQALPKIFLAPYRSNPNFTGRFEDLENLHCALGDHATVAVTAIAGTGGIGKTTLAAEYCHRFGGQYGGVWTIRAGESAVMLADLQELAKELGVGDGKNTEADAKAVLGRLRTEAHPWLLVYDNAPNPDAVSKWLPEGAVRCLITSRFAEFGDLAAVMRLDYWPEEVTADYLLSRTKRDDPPGVARLARTLGGLPLAAEQAATYLSPRIGVSFDDYAADIGRLIKRPKPKGATGDYPDTVYAAFVKSLETLRDMEDGNSALDILQLCAFLSPDGVELALLRVQWGHEVLPAELAGMIANNSAREDALAVLASLSLLRREDGPFGPVLSFHRLLLEVLRDWMGDDRRESWGHAAARLVGIAFPSGPDGGKGDPSTDTSVWPICARLMPHVASLEARVPRSIATGKTLARLLNQAGLYLAARGNQSGALTLIKTSAEIARVVYADDALEVATILNNLAAQYVDADNLKDAEEAYIEVLNMTKRHLPDNDIRSTRAMSNLAEVYWRRREFANAEQLFSGASEIVKSAQGTESAEYATLLSNLGSLYGLWADEPGQEARRAQEEEYKTRALMVTRVARGERHPLTATLHCNLAVMKGKMLDWSGAAQEAERAVAILLSLDLAQHPNARDTSNFLAVAWRQCGLPEKEGRLRRGDISDLLPLIAKIEEEHRAWVQKDSETRHFGPPSPFGPSREDVSKVARALAEAGVDVDELKRRVESGELSNEEASNIVIGKLTDRAV